MKRFIAFCVAVLFVSNLSAVSVGLERAIEQEQEKIVGGISKILASPANKASQCPILCNNLAIATEYAVFGSTNASCHCADVCHRLAGSKSRKSTLAQRALRTCSQNKVPQNLQISKEQVGKARPILKNLRDALKDKKVTIKVKKSVADIQKEEKAISGQEPPAAEAQALLNQEKKAIVDLINDEAADDIDVDELVAVILDSDIEIEALIYDPEVIETAQKLIDFLAQTAEEQKDRGVISPRVLKLAKENLQHVFEPVPAPQKVVKDGEEAFLDIIGEIRQGNVNFKIMYQTSKGVKEDHVQTQRIQKIVDQLYKEGPISPKDNQWLIERIALPGIRIIPGGELSIFASKDEQQKILSNMAKVMKKYRDAYIALQEHQKQQLEGYTAWQKKYSPEQFQQATVDLRTIINAIADPDITVQATTSKAQKQFDTIEKNIEAKRPLSMKQKRSFLDDIKLGSFKLKSIPQPGESAAKAQKVQSKIEKANISQGNFMHLLRELPLLDEPLLGKQQPMLDPWESEEEEGLNY